MRKTSLSIAVAAANLSTAGASEADLPATPPVVLQSAYTAEVWRNVSGGLRQDDVYIDNLDLAAAIDAEQAFGLPGTSLRISALYNNRSTLSNRIVGDLQTVSNIDTDGSLRLYEVWVEYAAQAFGLKAGLLDLNSEFDINETGALFVNSSHGIGPDFSQVGANGPAIFPITGLGLRARYHLSERVQVVAGVFEGTVGDPDHPRNTTVRLEGDEGSLWVGEIRVQPAPGLRTAVGVWRHSRVATELTEARSAHEHESLGKYAIVEGEMASFANHTLNAFVRFGFADPDVHQIARYQGAGMVLGGPLFGSAEQEEQLGIAIGTVTNGRPFRRLLAQAGTAVDSRETAIELTYRIQLNSWLALQPDIQYVINPGTDPGLDDAFMVGLRFELAMERSQF